MGGMSPVALLWPLDMPHDWKTLPLLSLSLGSSLLLSVTAHCGQIAARRKWSTLVTSLVRVGSTAITLQRVSIPHWRRLGCYPPPFHMLRGYPRWAHSLLSSVLLFGTVYSAQRVRAWCGWQPTGLGTPSARACCCCQCLTLCNPIDGSPPGSPIPGILQAGTLEWGAISFSNAGKWKVKVKLLSHVWLLATPWTAAHQAPPSMGFSRHEYWSGVLAIAFSVTFTTEPFFLWENNSQCLHIAMYSKYIFSAMHSNKYISHCKSVHTQAHIWPKLLKMILLLNVIKGKKTFPKSIF